MKEKGYYYDDGKYCEIETGPSFEDFPGMAQVVTQYYYLYLGIF